jgi:hypothetical protein
MAHRWDPVAPPVEGLVWPVAPDPAGKLGPTRGQARGPAWRKTSPGRFVEVSVSAALVEQRILEAYAGAGPNAVVTGWASLRLQAGGHFDGLAADGRTALPVPVAANGGRVRPTPGLLISRFTVPPDEVVVVHGIRCATIPRALYDEMRRLRGVRERVVAVDMACAARLTSIRRMRIYIATRRWYRDCRIVQPSLDLADEGSRSGQESRFRLVWEVDAGWGRPLCNREVFHESGRFIGIPDLLDPVRCVMGEFAGGDHRDIDRHESDIAREADFRSTGLEYVEVVTRDVRRPERVVDRMREAEQRAGQLPQTWVLGPEPKSLDEILDERDGPGSVE